MNRFRKLGFIDYNGRIQRCSMWFCSINFPSTTLKNRRLRPLRELTPADEMPAPATSSMKKYIYQRSGLFVSLHCFGTHGRWLVPDMREQLLIADDEVSIRSSSLLIISDSDIVSDLPKTATLNF